MGTDVHVVVTGGATAAGLLDWAQHEIESLDRRWTRFRDDSELSAVNAAAGNVTIVPADTFDVVEVAVAGWRETDGAFDPTVLDALVAAGYDRSFELVGAGAVSHRGAARHAAVPGCAGVVLDPDLCAITLPAGVALDLGGVGKGHTADRVASALVARGAPGACVNVGGDLRVEGTAPDTGWVVAVDEIADGHEAARVDLPSGAGMATSTTRRRRWSTSDGVASHHLIDPATGSPSASDVVAATVIAGSAAWAEIVATALIVRGTATAPALLDRTRTAALVTTAAGDVEMLNGFEEYLT